MVKAKKPSVLDIPETLQEDAKNLIKNAFQLFSQHTKDMSDELNEFNRRREETRRRIHDGAKRTSGRIV
jgi:hypothetical protein